MCFITRQFIVLASLSFVVAAEAAPTNQLMSNGEAATPLTAAEARVPGAADADAKDSARGGRRFGIGYEARQGIGAGAHGRHDRRIERSERDGRGR